MPLFGRTSTSVAGVASIAATISSVDGFIVCPPSITRAAPYASKSRRFPAPGTTATMPVSSVCVGSGTSPGTASSRRPERSSVCLCMFAISTPSIVPSRVPAASAAPGSSVWTWIFNAVSSPTTRSESPSRSSSASSAAGSSPSPSTTKTVQ